MPNLIPVVISAAVEGMLDEAVACRLISYVGAVSGPVYGKSGKGQVLLRLRGYANAARFTPWFVLVDLDTDAKCAPGFRKAHLKQRIPGLCFRIAVREVEAWLLADRVKLAGFLSVPEKKIPIAPESVEDPKRLMVDLAGASSHSDVRADMVPRPGSRRDVGQAYDARLIEFVRNHWRPEVAEKASDSLHRCIRCLRVLAGYPPSL